MRYKIITNQLLSLSDPLAPHLLSPSLIHQLDEIKIPQLKVNTCIKSACTTSVQFISHQKNKTNFTIPNEQNNFSDFLCAVTTEHNYFMHSMFQHLNNVIGPMQVVSCMGEIHIALGNVLVFFYPIRVRVLQGIAEKQKLLLVGYCWTNSLCH